MGWDILGSIGGLFTDDKGNIDKNIVTAGLVTAGNLISGFFSNRVQADANQAAIQNQKDQLAWQAAENEKDRQLRLMLAQISGRSGGGGGSSGPSPYSRMADILQSGSTIEQQAIANLLAARGKALG